MSDNQTVTLQRDCAATLIPSGTPVVLPAGCQVAITQSLGGSYTVIAEGNLARVAGKDADALGLVTPELAPASAQTAPEGEGSVLSSCGRDGHAPEPLDENLIWDQMRTCYDPEIPVNIVDLGLVYDCRVTPLPAGGHRVDAKMTLTAPGCGMGETIKSDVEEKIRSVAGVAEVNVELVWDPPWNQSMMSDVAKLELGLM